METRKSTLIPVPLPSDWSRIYHHLSEARLVINDVNIPMPPVPLILAGAAFSSANDILKRWEDLIAWANEYGFSDTLINNLPEPPNHNVAESIAGVSKNGKGWWPEIGEQFHDPKPKPNRKMVLDTLVKIKTNWKDIVGSELAQMTKPKKFTGQKFRRLVVYADSGINPSWGNWYSSNRNPEVFRKFRKTINTVISPMKVDHIEFITESWKKRKA